MRDKALELTAHIESGRGKAREIGLEEATLRRWKEAGDDLPPLRGRPLECLRAFLARRGALEGLGVPLTYADGLEEGREIATREFEYVLGGFFATLRKRSRPRHP